MKDIDSVDTIRLVHSVRGPTGQCNEIRSGPAVKIAIKGDAAIVDMGQQGTIIIPLVGIAYIEPVSREKLKAAGSKKA